MNHASLGVAIHSVHRLCVHGFCARDRVPKFAESRQEPSVFDRIVGGECSSVSVVFEVSAHVYSLSGHFLDPHARDTAEELISSVGTGIVTRALDKITPLRLMVNRGCDLPLTFRTSLYIRIITSIAPPTRKATSWPDFWRGESPSPILLMSRMMQTLSLYNLDEKLGREQSQQSSLINRESLRRLAWSIFMTDTQVDCGHFGMHAIDDESFTIQLPCEERPFLIRVDVTTESIIPGPESTGSTGTGNLGLTAHLLRTGLARRRVLHFASKLVRGMVPIGAIEAGVEGVHRQMRQLLDSLPSQMRYSQSHYAIYRDQQASLLALHAHRCIVEIAFGRLRIMANDLTASWSGQTTQARSDRIQHSLTLSRIFADAIPWDVPIDPSLEAFVYVALEGRRRYEY